MLDESGLLERFLPEMIALKGVQFINGKGHKDNFLQCSCLENPRDGGACWAAIYGVTQSRTQLTRLSSYFTFLCFSVSYMKFI